MKLQMATLEQLLLVLLTFFLHCSVEGQHLVMVDVSMTTTPAPEPRWGQWTQWSLCTTSTQNGVRVRSRACEIGSCDRISGENYEVQKCRPEAFNATVQDQAFLDKCTRDPTMNRTLSCRLYRENPIMAYGIYRSVEEMACDYEGKAPTDGRPKRCLFNIASDQIQAMWARRAASTRSTNEVRTQTTEATTTSSSHGANQKRQSLLEKIKTNMKITKACKEACQASSKMTSQVRSPDVSLASVDEEQQDTSSDASTRNFNTCYQRCRTSKSAKNNASKRGKLLSTILSRASSERNQKLSRRKRSVRPQFNPDNYRSPCFEKTEYSTTPRVMNLDDSDGELYFYEGQEQQFIRRRCSGRLFKKGLYMPIEPVRQEQTRLPALCKQGYLNRYGLLIELDPKGDFAFNNGERFSVRFRPFKLESHCALSTYRVY